MYFYFDPGTYIYTLCDTLGPSVKDKMTSYLAVYRLTSHLDQQYELQYERDIGDITRSVH